MQKELDLNIDVSPDGEIDLLEAELVLRKLEVV